MIKQITILTLVIILQSCAAPINRHNAVKHAQAGVRASTSGDWELSRKEWAKAVTNGELGNLPKNQQAAYYYEYGRAAGVTCFYDISENYLTKSYELDKKIGGPYFLSLVEMFRLNLDQKKYKKAVTYFEKVLPVLEKINAPKESPAEFSKLLDEYTTALKNSGRLNESKKMKARSLEIQKKAVKSITDRTPYGSKCT